MICAKKVQRNVGLVSKDPRVVRYWWNVEEIAGVHFDHPSIGESGGGGSGEYEADVLDVAVSLAQS
jgi:hypothetical protein